MQKKLFVVMGIGRSGSSVLCDLLSNHPEIICHGELFNPDVMQFSRFSTNANISSSFLSFEAREKQPALFLQSIFKVSSEAVVGFKFLHYQDKNVETFLLSNRNIKKIIIKRRNILERYVSLLLARETNNWINREGFDENINPEDIMFEINIEEFIETSKYIRNYYNRIERSINQEDFLTIYYEDFCNNYLELNNIYEFLKIEKITNFETVFRTTNKKKPENMISNYNELKMKAKDYIYLD